jgi:phosphatidylglycerol lysyltransferase
MPSSSTDPNPGAGASIAAWSPRSNRVAPTQPMVRIALSLAVAVMGIIDLLSAVLSHPPDRLMAIRRLVPTEVLDTTRTFTLLAGALLLVTAWGLRRGKRRAFVAALFLCAVSVPVNLLKALDFEEAVSATALMFLLGVNAEAFRVKSRELTFRAVRSRALIAALGLVIYSIAACWWVGYRFGHGGSFGNAVAEAGYQLFGIGNHSVLVRPHLRLRELRTATWMLNSVSVLGVALLVGIALLALRPVAHRRRHGGEARRVASLLREHGDSTVAAFALEHGNDYFFSANGRAVIAYRFESDALLCVGDPIGPEEEMPALLEAFAAFCREHDWGFAFFQARPERLPLYQRMGWRALHIGEDPILWTDRFSLEGGPMGDVRRSTNKMESAGIVARSFLPRENPFDPAHDPEGLNEQMRAISNEWVRERHGIERGFCMGRFDTLDFRGAWLVAAWNPTARRVEGFLTWTPIWARHGWALDLMRRRSDAPPGVMEFLVAKSVEMARARGDALLSLSLSALASVEEGEEASASRAPGPEGLEPAADERATSKGEVRRPAAARPDRARDLLMEHLARFYDFKNLFRWKKKFGPAFEDRYLVYPDALALPRVVLALARAQSPGGLTSYFRKAA